MSNTILIARINDQSIQLSNAGPIASGSQGVLQIRCEFDSLWTGYGKTAVFYREKSEVYHRPVIEGLVTIPHEVIAEEGCFLFGIFGTAENTRTTDVVRLDVRQGAITEATAVTEEPVPDIYSQIMAAYGHMEARMSEVIAMRGAGVVEQVIVEDGLQGVIYSNGASAFFSFEFSDSTLTEGNSRTYECIPPAFAPLALVALKSLANSQSATATISPRSWTQTDYAVIEITAGEDLADSVEFEVSYDLESIFLAELADIRVDNSGNVYPTAGDAVRALESKLGSDATGGNRLTVTINKDEAAASHTAGQIFEARSGGADVCATIPDEATRLSLLSVSVAYAVFVKFADDNSWEKYLIDDAGTVEYYNEYYALDDFIDDSKVGSNAWSSKHTVNILCPSFNESGGVVQCEPVAGYPLKVTTELPASEEGISEITLTQCGKNLFDYTQYPFINYYYDISSGLLKTSNGYSCINKLMSVGHLKGKTITLNHTPGDMGDWASGGMCFYAGSTPDTFISGAGGNGHTYVVPENAEYMGFSVPREFADGKQIQVEIGNAVTEFEAYRGQEYTVEFEKPIFEGGNYVWSDIHGLPGVNTIWSSCCMTSVEGKADPVAMICNLSSKVDALSKTVTALLEG